MQLGYTTEWYNLMWKKGNISHRMEVPCEYPKVDPPWSLQIFPIQPYPASLSHTVPTNHKSTTIVKLDSNIKKSNS